MGIAVLLVLGAGTARGGDDPYHDQAEKIPCPAAPPGWVNPPESDGGRAILTPLTTIAQADGRNFIFGAPVVQLDCFYLTSSGKRLQVSVRYALPIDLNPYNDFYIGCTVTGHPQNVATSAHAWDDSERIYRVVGKKTWSLATFIDDQKQLTSADVPRFEAVTNKMLEDAQPYAHDCGLAGNQEPVDLKTIWTFSFDVTTTSAGVTSSGTDSGSFVTTANTTGGSIGAIKNLFANDFHLNLTGKGKPRSLDVHVGDPIAFRHGYGVSLRTHVNVVSSTDETCKRGATGTLLLDLQYLSPPRVAIQLCGHTYLAGKGKVVAVMKPV